MSANIRYHFIFNLPGKQSGSTLIILIILMLPGVTAIQISDTRYKLAGNLQFENAAMNNTETAISAAETWLATGTNYANTVFTTYNAATPHLYPIGQLTDTAPLTMTWSDSNSIQVNNTNQRCIIELMSAGNHLAVSSQVVGGRASSGCNQVNIYRITACGASKFVQFYYSVLSCPPPA